jgi:hypothetical protein
MSKGNLQKNNYALFGLAAIVPGLQHAIDMLQQLLNEIKEELAHAQAHAPPAKQPRRAKLSSAAAGRKSWEAATPAQRQARIAAMQAGRKRKKPRGWSADPEERKREMQRRRAKRVRAAA